MKIKLSQLKQIIREQIEDFEKAYPFEQSRMTVEDAKASVKACILDKSVNLRHLSGKVEQLAARLSDEAVNERDVETAGSLDQLAEWLYNPRAKDFRRKLANMIDQF